jgi:hypothetical protein
VSSVRVSDTVNIAMLRGTKSLSWDIECFPVVRVVNSARETAGCLSIRPRKTWARARRLKAIEHSEGAQSFPLEFGP